MTSIEDIIKACAKVDAMAPPQPLPDLPSKPELDGAPEWHPIEYEAWKIGEDIRQALSNDRRLKLSPEVLDRVLIVVENSRLRRGRQSFVMALSHSAAAHLSDRIVHLLDDPDICGHVVSALLKMRAFDYALEVSPLVNSETIWIKKKAKLYIEKAEQSKPNQPVETTQAVARPPRLT